MTDHEESKSESLMEKMTEKFHGDDSSSSSDSDDDTKSSPLKSNVYRMFGREKPVHKVLGGGKTADILLWRDKKISGGLLGGATAIWVLFELLEYHLLTLVCHGLILALPVLNLWSIATSGGFKVPRPGGPSSRAALRFSSTRSRPSIPEVNIPEEPVLEFASALTTETNRAFKVLKEIALGRDLKKFLSVIAGLWILSMLGSCCSSLTLFYIAFVLLHTVPVLYEKYEDQVDGFAEKAMIEIKKQYASLMQRS